ncbi:Transposon Ty3-G Gag-Pol polyprotein [Arachis hypogaea]|nr:Transposon Ty3-G Gag-Pol polyprotein [Arachis hypogaea]
MRWVSNRMGIRMTEKRKENSAERKSENLVTPRVEVKRRVEVPTFDGEDVCGWLAKIERYFRMAQIQYGEKLDYVTLAFNGEAFEVARMVGGTDSILHMEEIQGRLAEEVPTWCHRESDGSTFDSETDENGGPILPGVRVGGENTSWLGAQSSYVHLLEWIETRGVCRDGNLRFF